MVATAAGLVTVLTTSDKHSAACSGQGPSSSAKEHTEPSFAAVPDSAGSTASELVA